MGKGFAGTIFLATDDCQASYEQLRARGVEFVEKPEQRPYGVDAGLRTHPATACASRRSARRSPNARSHESRQMGLEARQSLVFTPMSAPSKDA